MPLKVLPFEKPFLQLLDKAGEDDANFKAAAGKVRKKVFKKFALEIGLEPNKLCLMYLITEQGEIQPELAKFIERFPQRPSQTAESYAAYQYQTKSIVGRIVSAVAVLATGGKLPVEQEDDKRQVPILEAHDHPLLEELYKLLPRAWERGPGVQGGRRAEHLSLDAMLFYAGCAEAIRRLSPSTLSELLVDRRGDLNQVLQEVCALEKYPRVTRFIPRVCRAIGVAVDQVQSLPEVSSWPKKLQSQWTQYFDVTKGIIPPEVLSRSVEFGITLNDKLSVSIVAKSKYTISRILSKQPQGDAFGLEELLAFERISVVQDGRRKTVQFNRFLSPWREKDKARADAYKRAGFDSTAFKTGLNSLLTFASYIGLFKCVKKVKKIIKIKIDRKTPNNRKARKKQLIDRKVLDKWFGKNWPEFEGILRSHTFERQKNNKDQKKEEKKHSHRESDKNMRFVNFYIKFLTLFIMGYRQQALRDCLYGENLVVTQNSIKWHFRRDQMKTKKQLDFTAILPGFEKTHGLLVRAHYLFHKEAFNYIQGRLDFWLTGDPAEDRLRDPTGQVFVKMRGNGTFRRFHPIKGHSSFNGQFKRDCVEFLGNSGLSKAAIQAIHAHYCRGASMDVFIIDRGGSKTDAEQFFGVDYKTIDYYYKDRNAAQDASRGVLLMNLTMDQIDRFSKGTSGVDPEIKLLRKELKAARKRQTAQEAENARLRASKTALEVEIAGLRAQVTEMNNTFNTRLDAVIDALKGKAAA